MVFLDVCLAFKFENLTPLASRFIAFAAFRTSSTFASVERFAFLSSCSSTDKRARQHLTLRKSFQIADFPKIISPVSEPSRPRILPEKSGSFQVLSEFALSRSGDPRGFA
jgi:hypothetical protein